MQTPESQPRRAATRKMFEFLSDVPWWVVIVSIVGIVVAFSVLTDIQYLDAIYFLFDLPWNKALIAQVPVEGDTWQFTPGEKTPFEPGTYKLFVEFDQVMATVREETALYAEPDINSTSVGQLQPDETVCFVKWHIIPREGLTMEQNWGYVNTEDGRSGWVLDKQLGRFRYSALTESEIYVITVPEGATPAETEPITQPGKEPVEVDSSTPTIQGEVKAGSWVRVYDRYDWKQTLVRAWRSDGLMLTLRATILGFGLAFILGLIAGLMLVSDNPILLAVSKLYVEVVRGIPMLVIILYAGFVLSPALREATNGSVDLRGFPGAVIGLGFGYGAYLAEVFRAGIQSIHYGQMEAARSLGMTYFQAMRHVILPQAIRVVLPPLGNDFIAMLKDSSLISVVALPEILQQGRLWVSRTFRAFEGYNTVALFYLVMTLVLSLLVRVIERRTALPGRSEE